MHSPTLVIVAAILAALVTTVLSAVWFFNRNIPGLRLWTLALFCTTVFCMNLMLRNHMPQLPSVLLAQGSIAMTAYLCLLGAREYTGRAPLHHGVAAGALVLLLTTVAYFTVVQPNLEVRFVLSGLVPGVCFLFAARTMARGGFRKVPARYLFAGTVGVHGVFLLVRPMLFKLATPQELSQPEAGMVAALSQFVVLESTIALVLVAFGALMLTNEFITNELRHLAEVDPLTNVFNRRAFLTLLDKAISNAQRTQTTLPVLVMDLDHFKKVNDSWGHRAGDDVLRHFVMLAQRCLRKEDVMGRLGGEEFAIFLPNAVGSGAIAVAERLRALVEAHPVVTEQRTIALTVSIGVTLCSGSEAADTALQRADETMYRAKERGRNRVEMTAVPTTPVTPAAPAAPVTTTTLVA
ncbi:MULTISPECIES: GGDEF domain-containing protein [unclassified Acidovorax]|uniref:GGDEF domain-containing protein n=1 Tax=unclassified Acidovorax TaxID=2684926 RepID=UPI0007019D7D|nr:MULTISPECIES: GGDEF domain-containing protein [unclassified Acidovorax]KRB28952.1 diguanylate cyclase [Acidovorax sp. Root70]PUA97103.1 diguanylate cyclase (GGDEF)-like protein [Acidovorax sp. 107]